MTRSTRTVSALAAGVLAAGTLAAGAVAVSGPANAAPRQADITARASDYTVQSGEQFIVRGRFTIAGAPAADHTVKIQALYGHDWRAIRGAHVDARSDGTYRVRVILFTQGDRELRAVGVAPGRNAYDAFAVQVG